MITDYAFLASQKAAPALEATVQSQPFKRLSCIISLYQERRWIKLSLDSDPSTSLCTGSVALPQELTYDRILAIVFHRVLTWEHWNTSHLECGRKGLHKWGITLENKIACARERCLLFLLLMEGVLKDVSLSSDLQISN